MEQEEDIIDSTEEMQPEEVLLYKGEQNYVVETLQQPDGDRTLRQERVTAYIQRKYPNRTVLEREQIGTGFMALAEKADTILKDRANSLRLLELEIELEDFIPHLEKKLKQLLPKGRRDLILFLHTYHRLYAHRLLTIQGLDSYRTVSVRIGAVREGRQSHASGPLKGDSTLQLP